ncbi:S-adenosylmethionine:tRNA ribosyltransferase-isomerase [Yinghuangia soli]|uniref:S-adenosylmethionine:tRNA ribosyltransferase-isomerase n=1 Tax=Yinghuangia soli TaxID=2908204 RepID=A0AA41Q5V4_9ACTN|nr:S-adenosylmethionine:tRNA ribosyltransferase-isomerase [Yinghuangia soli]MCF2531836.1 S-adenosylmethionine:tRNA ribosyltransferase-isomerase [Yinghuangia soli]
MKVLDLAAAQTRFSLPDELHAAEPPEARGLTRDGVRLLVADGGGAEGGGAEGGGAAGGGAEDGEAAGGGKITVRHARFRELGAHLRPGDLLVVNTSGTLPAAVDAVREDGRGVIVHFSTELDDGRWLAELRPPDNKGGPIPDGRVGEAVLLPGGVRLHVDAAYPDPCTITGSRLWAVRTDAPAGVPAYLAEHGRPITYGYLRGRWPLAHYQTVFSRDPGSAEMPSAARPFTNDIVLDLIASGVVVAPITLHTGVSSLEAGEPPLPERYRVPEQTARLVELTRRSGGRVIAVGTTATRALESAALPDGSILPGEGWTDLVLGPDRPAYVVDGLISGLHAPDASHLLLLEAVAGPDVVGRAYEAALEHGYLWHEFGDSSLLLR